MGMKLKLHNFRHFIDKTIELPEHGLILLDGKNGCGKSTIFFAILFALYGKIRKPWTKGHTAGYVEMTSEKLGIFIRRSTTLSTKYKDATYDDKAAQDVIDKVVGVSWDVFKSVSYVGDTDDSVLSMSPSDQSRFVMNLAFGNDQTNLFYKRRVREYLSESKNMIIRLETEKNMYQEELSKLPDPEELPDLPALDTGEQKRLKSHIDAINNRLTEIEEDMREYPQRKQKLQQINTLTTEIAYLKQESEKLSDAEERVDIETKLTKYRQNKQAYINYTEKQKHFDTLKTQYFDELRTRKQQLAGSFREGIDYDTLIERSQEHSLKLADQTRKIQKLYSEMEMYGYEIPDQTLVGLDELITRVKVDIDNIRSSINESVTLDLSLKCPNENCGSLLRVLNGSLVLEETPRGSGDTKVVNVIDQQLTTESLKSQLSFLDHWLAALTDIINQYIDVLPEENNLDVLLTERNSLTKYKSACHKIDNEVLSPTLTSFLAEPKGYEDEFILDDDYEKELTDTLADLEKYNSLLKQMENKKQALKKLQGSETEIKDFDSLTAEQAELNKSLTEKLNSLEEASQCARLREQKVRYEKLNAQLENVTSKLTQHEEKLEGLNEFEEMCKKAQMIAVNNTITGINSNASDYLKRFWPGENIIVRLENVKTTKVSKDVKLQMNTKIEHQGAEFDHVSEFCGGERQKAKLAFILGMNQFINPGKILILDECLNNLRPEVNSELLGFLHEFAAQTKTTVMVVSHESVRGHFDHVIDF